MRKVAFAAINDLRIDVDVGLGERILLNVMTFTAQLLNGAIDQSRLFRNMRLVTKFAVDDISRRMHKDLHLFERSALCRDGRRNGTAFIGFAGNSLQVGMAGHAQVRIPCQEKTVQFGFMRIVALSAGPLIDRLVLALHFRNVLAGIGAVA